MRWQFVVKLTEREGLLRNPSDPNMNSSPWRIVRLVTFDSLWLTNFAAKRILKRVLPFLLLSLPLVGLSQRKTSDHLSGSIAVAKNQGALTIHYQHFWKLGEKQRLQVGYGIRLTTFVASNQNYITAPASLSKQSTSPFILFKKRVDENLDTLLVDSPWMTSINASINVKYQFNSLWSVAFTVDAVGFSFGRNQQARFFTNSNIQATSAKPTTFDALLVDDNDLGNLNSELYISYQFEKRWNLNAGVQFLATEYTTATKVQQYPAANDRFRKTSLMFALGVSYQIH